MNFKSFMNQTEPELLQKMAEETQNDLIDKLIVRLTPLLEKHAEHSAEWAAYLVLEKLAEATTESQEAAPGAAKEEAPSAPVEAPVAAPGPKTNEMSSPVEGTGLDTEALRAAINEAVDAQQPDKILPFIKAIGENNPPLIPEIAKVIKTELHSAVMASRIEEEAALEITNTINALLGDK